MLILYDFIFLIFTLIYLPVYLFKGKFHRGFLRRLGFLPKGLDLDRPIWIHAVSVGEAVAVKGLVEELRRSFPDKKFVISTVTATGNKIASRVAGEGDFVTYLPLDFRFIVKSVLGQIKPCLFVIAETEIWPNLIHLLYNKKIPAVTVNGRISDSSFKGYLAIKFLLKSVLNKITLFCVQSERDAQRLSRLGVAGNKIKITGNMKFDSAGFKIDTSELIKCRANLSLSPSQRLWVCGSTHKGEEEKVLGVYKGLQSKFLGLKLLIAPRHPERAREIEKLTEKYGFKAERISQLASLPVSQLNRPTGQPANQPTVFILDTIGQLVHNYAVADIVFMGGSLVNKGGHNVLEPAFLEKPILFGPHMSNFRDIADLLLENNAAIMVQDQRALQQNLEELLSDPRRCLELGSRARQVILENQGATHRNAQLLTQYCG